MNLLKIDSKYYFFIDCLQIIACYCNKYDHKINLKIWKLHSVFNNNENSKCYIDLGLTVQTSFYRKSYKTILSNFNLGQMSSIESGQ